MNQVALGLKPTAAKPGAAKPDISTTQLRPEHVHVTVRMHWPPNFQPVVSGKLVVYLPWEFEVIPESWVAALNAAAAEVWVPARFVARGMVRLLSQNELGKA
jgi:hypothetical protein